MIKYDQVLSNRTKFMISIQNTKNQQQLSENSTNLPNLIISKGGVTGIGAVKILALSGRGGGGGGGV